MSELEDPELTSSYEHTKITTIYRATINEKDHDLGKKLFHNKRYKEGITMRQEGGAETLYNQDPRPGWESHKWEGYYNSRGSPQGVRCLIPHQAHGGPATGR